MSSRHHRQRPRDAKQDHKEASGLPLGMKGYKKIFLPELPIIDLNSGSNISNIRDAIVQYCQREVGPISQMLIDGHYKAPATATFDAIEVAADPTGVRKDQAAARLKRADIENEKYELSKLKLHGILSGMCTRELEDRIKQHRDSRAELARKRDVPALKTDYFSTLPAEKAPQPEHIKDSQCPLDLWNCIIHVTTAKTIGNTKVDQNNLIINFANLRQRKDESIHDFQSRLKNMLASFKAIGLEEPKEEMVAMRFLHGLDDSRYSTLKIYLGNEASQDRDLYQVTLQGAVAQATKWLVQGNKAAPIQPPQQPISAFVAEKKPSKGGKKTNISEKKTGGKYESNVETCDFCNNKGHSMKTCHKFEAAQKVAKASTAEKVKKFGQDKKPFPMVTGAMLATCDSDSECDTPLHKNTYHVISLLAGQSSQLNPYEVILDTGANGSIVHNKDLLHDVHRQASLTFGGLAGSLVTNKQGRIRDLCEAHYHANSPANIISFSQLREEIGRAHV